jgi:hypothetical protein
MASARRRCAACNDSSTRTTKCSARPRMAARHPSGLKGGGRGTERQAPTGSFVNSSGSNRVASASTRVVRSCARRCLEKCCRSHTTLAGVGAGARAAAAHASARCTEVVNFSADSSPLPSACRATGLTGGLVLGRTIDDGAHFFSVAIAARARARAPERPWVLYPGSVGQYRRGSPPRGIVCWRAHHTGESGGAPTRLTVKPRAPRSFSLSRRKLRAPRSCGGRAGRCG